MQDSLANCGPSASKNALNALGMNRSIEELEALLKTNATIGTKAVKLVKGLATIDGLAVRTIDEAKASVALLRLDHSLRNGRPVVLIVDKWEHYVAAVGQLGPRYLIADSADNELILSYEADELLKRWGKVGAKRPYWGVVL